MPVSGHAMNPIATTMAGSLGRRLILIALVLCPFGFYHSFAWNPFGGGMMVKGRKEIGL